MLFKNFYLQTWFKNHRFKDKKEKMGNEIIETIDKENRTKRTLV